MTTIRQLLQTGPAKANELFAKLVDTSDGAIKTRERLFADLKAELEDATGVTPLFVSAPLGEGMETLLDAVIQRLGTVKEAEEEATEEHPWSPL